MHFCIPEIRGMTLEEMGRVFGSRTGDEDAIMLSEARRDVDLSLNLENDAIKAVEHGERLGGKKGAHVESVWGRTLNNAIGTAKYD